MKLILELDLDQMPTAGRAFDDIADAVENLRRIIPTNADLPGLLDKDDAYQLVMEGSCSHNPQYISARMVIVHDKFLTKTLGEDQINITPERMK